jgi:hypothetical protein
MIDRAVAIAAPIIPEELSIPKIEGRGIKIIFSIILVIDATIISARISLDFPAIESRLFEITAIEATNDPNIKILKALLAIRYWLPNKMFIDAPGKTNIKIKIGKFTRNTHFPSCLLSCSIKM